MVRLEETHYRIDRSVTEIEVCVWVSSPFINCPIEFPFEIGFAIDHQSAGVCVCVHVVATHIKNCIERCA